MNTTTPCPSDQAAPVAPVRSDLAALALEAGIAREDVQAFTSGHYRIAQFQEAV